ncbi:MAG: hypothetical protein NTX25_04850, partial [Proteobacteria bacterium]|nr:hypothetical protein [Pseudomonadota bacterium]
MNSKRWFALISIIAIAGLSLVFALRNMTHKSDDKLSLPRITSPAKPSNRIKKHANSIVSINQVATSRSPEASNNDFAIPETLPVPCRNVSMIRDILNSTAEIITDSTQSYSSEVKSCLIELGSSENCFSQTSLEDEDKSCLNNFILARARLIDQLSANRPLD